MCGGVDLPNSRHISQLQALGSRSLLASLAPGILLGIGLSPTPLYIHHNAMLLFEYRPAAVTSTGVRSTLARLYTQMLEVVVVNNSSTVLAPPPLLTTSRTTIFSGCERASPAQTCDF